MSRVAILTTAVGYQTEQVEKLWTSLQRTGFKDRLVMLVDAMTADAIEKDTPDFVQLLVYEKVSPQDMMTAAPAAIQQAAMGDFDHDDVRFLTEAFKIHPVWTSHFFASFNHPSVFRYFFYRDYLEQNAADIDVVISCDCRDVVFQTNPSDVLKADAPLTFGYEAATTNLGSEAFNEAWVKHLWGQDVLSKYLGRRISCSGATYGSTKDMIRYIDMICDNLLNLASRTKAGYGFDQAIHNRLWWDNLLSGLQMTENFQSEVVNLFGEKDADVLRHYQDGVLWRADTTTPVMLVHQYDRYPAMALKAAEK